MGLLDSLFSDDPKNQATLAMALGLLSPTQVKMGTLGQIGQAGLLGVKTYGDAQQQQMKQRTDERANRASDLQQLSGTYALLRQASQRAQADAYEKGLPPPPDDPRLAQIEARMASVFPEANLGGRSAPGLPPPAAPVAPQVAPQPPGILGAGPPPAPQPPMPAPQPSQQGPQMSTPQSPQFNIPPPATAPPVPVGPGRAPRYYGPAGGMPYSQWLETDPTGMAYMKQVAEDNKPLILRQGDAVARNPDGTYHSVYQQPSLDKGIVPQRDKNGQVVSAAAIPNYAPAAASIAGAQTGATEAAKFPYSEVTNASGARVPAFLSGIQPPGQTQAPPGVASLQVTQPSKTAGQWADVPKRYVPQGTGQTTFDKAMADKQAESASTIAQDLGTKAEAANQRIALNNQASALVDKADTGPLAAQIGDVKNWLVSRFNIPESSFVNTPSATAALQKDLLNAATNRAKQQFGARMTQSEVMLMLQRGAPNIDMPKAAIKYLIDSDNKMSQYAIQQANDFGGYLGAGGDPMQFSGYYARKNPASAAMSGAELKTGASTAGVRRYNPQTGKIE